MTANQHEAAASGSDPGAGPGNEDAADAVGAADGQAVWDHLVARTGAVRQWVVDWELWRHTREAAAAVDRWRSGRLCPAACSTVDDVVAACGRDRAVAQERADARLAVLAGEAARGDRAAARVVLQRVLPGLVSQAARRASQLSRPFDELVHELAASAWFVIVSYPVERRPIKVAVNVVRDADYRLFGYTPVAERPERLFPVEPWVVDRLAETRARLDGRPEDAPKLASIELLEFLGYAVARGFSRPEAQLLAELFGLGLPVPEVARKHGVAPRTMRRYRLHALQNLAAWGATRSLAADLDEGADTPPAPADGVVAPGPQLAPEAA
jgi:hypothetical protein